MSSAGTSRSRERPAARVISSASERCLCASALGGKHEGREGRQKQSVSHCGVSLKVG